MSDKTLRIFNEATEVITEGASGSGRALDFLVFIRMLYS